MVDWVVTGWCNSICTAFGHMLKKLENSACVQAGDTRNKLMSKLGTLATGTG